MNEDKPVNEKPVIFLDSGIGGIPYCLNFIEHNRDESVYYLADRENFPYGQRKKEDLIAILTYLTEKLTKIIDPKIIVLACNTAAISALFSLRQSFPKLLFVGTIPAIKPAANASKTGKIGVLGTTRTIEDEYIQNLKGSGCEIFGIAAPELVDFVEQRFDEASKKEKTKIVKKYIDLFRKEGADTLVLGCTHFLFLIDEFRKEAGRDIMIFDSIDGITKRIETLLNENVLRAGSFMPGSSEADKPPAQLKKPTRCFLLTGTKPPDSSWQKKALSFGFDLCLLNETVPAGKT